MANITDVSNGLTILALINPKAQVASQSGAFITVSSVAVEDVSDEHLGKLTRMGWWYDMAFKTWKVRIND